MTDLTDTAQEPRTAALTLKSRLFLRWLDAQFGGGMVASQYLTAETGLRDIEAAVRAEAAADRSLTGTVTVEALRADLAKFMRQYHPSGTGDWACAECHPKDSDMLIAGFQCVPHAALGSQPPAPGGEG